MKTTFKTLSRIPGIGPWIKKQKPFLQTDEERLSTTLEMLYRDSKLEFTGEYGAELTTFLPLVAWLKQEGHLKGRRIISYDGMQPYYFFLSEDEFVGKKEIRRAISPAKRYWPSNTTHQAVRSPWHVYPDFRTHYADSDMHFKKPAVFIQNKYMIEWKREPLNYIPLRGLKKFLELVSDDFDVVYSRPNNVPAARGYSRDISKEMEYPDAEVVERFPGVINFERMCVEKGLDYNKTKLEILAKSHFFVGVQGGGSHLLSYFGDSVLTLLHIAGNEYPHAYQHGPYKYLAKHAPTLLVARNSYDFVKAMEYLAENVAPENHLHSLNALISKGASDFRDLIH